MQVICRQSQLNSAITMVQQVIASRSTRSILEGILFTAGEKLVLTGYDMETGIDAHIDADIREGGQLVLNSRIFGDIVRKLPEEMVKITSDADHKVKIESGLAKFEIFGRAADDYPQIPLVEKSQKLVLSQRIFKTMINQTKFAASSDESRPILNGIKVEAAGSKVEIVAIDGFRLAVCKEDDDQDHDKLSFIVPVKAMSEVERSMEDSDDPITISYSHNHILFETDDFRLVSRLIQGEFIDYSRIIPPSCTSRIKVKTQALLDAMERASLLINVEQRRFPVTFASRSDEELEIFAQTDMGSINESVPIELTGNMIDIDFNPKYFLDALRVIQDEDIILELSGSAAPCLIKPIDGDSFLYMLLPLRR